MVGLPCRQVVVQLDLGQKIRMGRALGSLDVIFALPFPSWRPTVPWFEYFGESQKSDYFDQILDSLSAPR